MLTKEDTDTIQIIVTSSVNEAIENLARILAISFESIEKRFNDIESQMATKEDLQDMREEFSVRYDNRLDRHADDIRLLKTNLGLR